MSLAKKIAHNTLIQVAGKIVSTVLGLFSLALITRYLGQTGFGEYTTIMTFLTFFAVIADLGLTLVTVQMISGQRDDENKILNNLFSLRLVSALLFIGIAPFIVMFFPYSATVKFGVLIAAASFVFPALNQILVGLFQKKLNMDRAALAEVISRVVLIIGIILTQKYEAGLRGILITSIASSAASFLLHYIFACKFAVVKFEFDLSLWKKIISRSWPLAITIVLNLIYLRADTLILSLFRGPEIVGLYGAAYKILDVLTTLPFMFAGLILPILTSAWAENNKPFFKKILQKSFDCMAIVAIPLMIGAQFLGKPIMYFVAGKDFVLAGDILKILIFAVAAIFLGTMFSHAVIAIDKQKKMIGFYVFTSISSLAAYLYLIPRYSYIGAASVTIYSELLIAIFSAYCIFKYTRFFPSLCVVIKSIIAGLAMGALIYILPAYFQASLGGLLFILILASLAYFLFLYLLGGINSEDLRSIFSKQTKSGGQVYDTGTNL
ncbi:MAG: flippase [Candidatus Falkowbacteria bacterium]